MVTQIRAEKIETVRIGRLAVKAGSRSELRRDVWRGKFFWETKESGGLAALFAGEGIPCDMFGKALREPGFRME